MRTALVTGGVRGIGAAIARALHDNGYNVVVSYARNGDEAKNFEKHTGIKTYCWDVADFDACVTKVKQIEEEAGYIEVLINNAGIIRDSMMHKMDIEAWHQVINVNLGGCFNMCRATIEGMRHRQWGRIVNISSINALSGCMGQTNYAASKAGIIGLTKSLALENASKKITVNAVAPGYIKTDMTDKIPDNIREAIAKKIPVGHMGMPADIAGAVVFLVSDGAGFITGATFNVNGGDYMQ